MSERGSVVFTPAELGPITLRNRVVKAATFEGMTPGGLVSDELIAFHAAPAAGGVGMTTLAYCAVASEGRTYRDQIWMREEAVPGLRRLTDAVHAEGARAAIQLGHAGWFANPSATGEKAIGPSRTFSPYAMGFPRPMRDDDFARLLEAYRRAARLSVEAGFDALEIHMGHGYLLSQFLSPFTNKRSDRYGGSLSNRARILREVALATRDEIVRIGAARSVAVYAKLNMEDGFDGGLMAHEGVLVARMLEADGALDALQLTGGFTGKTPMYLMRGETPLRELIELEPSFARRLGMRLVAPLLLRPFPFEEAFFLPLARQVRAEVKMPLMLLGGITQLETMDQALAEGFAFVAVARALLRDPLLVRKLEAGAAKGSICDHCNKCVTEMDRAGTRCVFVPRGPPPPL